MWHASPAVGRRPHADWDVAAIDPALLTQFLCHQALEIRARSRSTHSGERPLAMVGQSPAFVAMLDRIAKVARYRESVLITGESGSGKEHVAQAISLLEPRQGLPFVSVSCPQYQEGNLTVSELFGHVKGSFTGAVADHAGAFAQAHTGTLFLDEIADLPASAQAMLLRTLATGEYKPVGASDGRRVDVRVVAATNRPLNEMMASGAFRHDLFFRLRHFHVTVPPLRERGDDWRLIAEFCLAAAQPAARREEAVVAGCRTVPGGLHVAGQRASAHRRGGCGIRAGRLDFDRHRRHRLTARRLPDAGHTGGATGRCGGRGIRPVRALQPAPLTDAGPRGSFWNTVHRAFMDRDLNRSQVRAFISRGLDATRGSYRDLVELLGLPATDYQRFMDFLRHQDLKPDRGSDSGLRESELNGRAMER